MTRAEMLAEARAVVDDTVPDYGWTDTRLLNWLSEGQDKFCEETGYFVDITNYTVDTVADQAVYAIDDRIISVLDVYYGAYRLGRVEDADRSYPAYAQFPISHSIATAEVPSYWQADEATQSLRFFPTPTTVETLTLRVWRYPRYELTNDDFDGAGNPAVPELPNRLQLACVEWAAFKAFSDHDAERQDPVKARDHKAAFDAYVTDGKKARRRMMQQTATARGNPLYNVNG